MHQLNPEIDILAFDGEEGLSRLFLYTIELTRRPWDIEALPARLEKVAMFKILMQVILTIMLIIGFFMGGTYSTRIEVRKYASDSNYYKGTITSLELIGAKNGGGSATLGCYILAVCPLAVLMTVPIDVLVDTLSLPYDYVHRVETAF